MNNQSNVYTIIYIIVLVVVVGAAIALTSMSLHDRQQANANADKMRQILASVHLSAPTSEIGTEFDRYITSQYIVDESGAIVSDNGAFSVDVAAQSKVEPAKRKLPVYECTLAAGDVKYIVPLYGAGLWVPLCGYVAFQCDGSTLYGAYFAHQGETPGLGAEIEKPQFSDQFEGKTVFHDDKFLPIAVVKAGQKPLNGEDYVDGISGGTITSKGVGAMLDSSLTPYAAFLSNLRSK